MDDCCSAKRDDLAVLAQQKDQRRVLIIVLAINTVMFVVEFGAGVIAGSSALMADSVDMLGDASVYALSLYAIGRGTRWEAGAALAKAGLMSVLGIVILVNAVLRVSSGTPPIDELMLGAGGLALIANLACLGLLSRFRATNVNMASTWECSRNDVISNIGVLIAAGLVALTFSPWPDAVIGVLVAVMFLRSSWRVMRQSLPVWRRSVSEAAR